MKATGIVRKIDALGRIVLPKELRDKMYIQESDPLEIFVEEDAIIIKKYASMCVFCGKQEDDLVMFSGRTVCPACIAEIKRKG